MKKILFQTVLLKGEAGNSIASIAHKSTEGRTEVYTITLTDGSTFDYSVVNGVGIASIEKTSTVGAVDTYTITLTDGSTTTFDVTNGGVVVDEALSSSSTNPVQNKVINNRIVEIEDSLNAINDAVASSSTEVSKLVAQIVPSDNVQDDEIATQTYIKGKYLVMNGKLYKVTSTIIAGDTIEAGTNVEETSLTGEFLARSQVYHSGSFYYYEGSLNQWESVTLEVVDLAPIRSYLGSGWYMSNATATSNHDNILTGIKVTENAIYVTICNSAASAQSGITVDVGVDFYHPALA